MNTQLSISACITKRLLCICLVILYTAPLFAKQEKRKPQSTTEKKSLKITPLKNIDIQKVMDYPLDEVIKRYRKDYHTSEEEAALHEKELKRYLILSAEYDDEPIDMFSHEVDNLWHTFLLFTKDYQRFCHDMFGHFIHHVPKIDSDKENVIL